MIQTQSLPLNADGLHELVLHVASAKDRFCYRYEWNGAEQVTAPTIRVHRGERFALRLINDLSGPAPASATSAAELPACAPMPMPMPNGKPRTFVGYLNHTFQAHYVPMDAADVNLHLHGFQGPAQQEDVFLSTRSTPAHACEYDVTIPRTQPPGTYFYHPHAHGMADDEVAGGLSGMWIVEPDTAQIPAADEHVLVLRYSVPFVSDNPKMPNMKAFALASAMHLAALSDPAPVAYDPFNPPPWPTPFVVRAAGRSLYPHGCGSFDVPLSTIDGVTAPAWLAVPSGEPQLIRFLDATSDSFKYLRLRDGAGRVRPMHIVGRDGVPVSSDDAHPLARYLSMNGVLLPPTGRIDMLLTLSPGETLTLYGDSRCGSPVGEVYLRHDLLNIEGGPAPAAATLVASRPLSLPESRARKLLDFASSHPELVRRRAITYTEYSIFTGGKPPVHPEFYITDTTNPNFHEHPFMPQYRNGDTVPSNPDIVVKHGSIEEWYIFNATLEEHSFHIHQMAFAAEDEPGDPAMLDTAVIPVGTLLPNRSEPDYPLIKPSRTRVLLDFRNVPRGEFVFHCHMLFHEDRGMMATIRVE